MKIKLFIATLGFLGFALTSFAANVEKVIVYSPEYGDDANSLNVKSFQPFEIEKPGVITVAKIQEGVKNGSFKKYFPDVIFIKLGSLKTAMQSIRGNGTLVQRLTVDAGSYQILEAAASKSRVDVEKIYVPIEYNIFVELANATSPGTQLTLSK